MSDKNFKKPAPTYDELVKENAELKKNIELLSNQVANLTKNQ